VNLEITVPAENVGDIPGDLPGKRGRVLGQETLPGNFLVIKGQVPLAEVTRYNSQLKSVTCGRGTYSMTSSNYEVVPPNIQQQAVPTDGKKKEEDN
jgi:elongation factor G